MANNIDWVEPQRNYRLWAISFAVAVALHAGLYINAQVHRKEFYRRLNEKLHQLPASNVKTTQSNATTETTVHIGDKLPPAIEKTLLRLADGPSVKEKYTLFIAFTPTCPACHDLLNAVLRNYAILAPFVRVVGIRQAEETKEWFSQKKEQKYPFPIISDLNHTTGKTLGLGEIVPYWALYSPENKLVLQGDGFQGSRDTGSQLTDGLVARFANRSTATMPITQWENYIPTEVAPIKVGKKFVSIREMSNKGLVVMTFLNNGGFLEAKRVRQLQDMARNSPATFLFVTDAETQQFFELKNTANTLVTTADSKSLFKQFEISKGPITILFYRGRSFAIEGAVSQDDSFMRLVCFSDFICKPNQNVGQVPAEVKGGI